MSTTSQWWMHVASGIPTSGSSFCQVQGAILGNNTTEAQISSVVSSGGNAITMKTRLVSAPGAGKSIRFQLSINASPSAVLDYTISDAATTGSATGTVAIAAGDLVAIKMTASGTPTSSQAETCIEFEPTTSSNYCYPCNHGNGTSKSGAPAWQPLLYGNNADITGGESISDGSRSISPIAGTITALYVALNVAPGAGKSWTFGVLKNGVLEASSAVTISDANTAGNATGLSIAVAAGDLLTWEITSNSGSPAATRVKWSVTLVPTLPTRYILGGKGNTSRTASVYNAQVGTVSTADTTEANVQFHAPGTMYACAIAGANHTAPGVGNSWTWRQRVNTGNGTLAALESGTATSAVDAAHVDALVADDLIDVYMEEGGTAAGTNGQTYAVAFSNTFQSPGGVNHNSLLLLGVG